VLYAWSPQELNLKENNAIGLPSGVAGDPTNTANNTQDHIDQIVEAHGYWQRFDPTTYDVSLNAENLKGMYKATEWTNTTLFNMELVVASPGRLSYLAPIPTYYTSANQVVPLAEVEVRDRKYYRLVDGESTTIELTQRVSAVVGEVLGVTVAAPGAAGEAILARLSTHLGNPEASFPQFPSTGTGLGPPGRPLEYSTRLYKDGVPIQDTVVAPAPVPFWWYFVTPVVLPPAGTSVIQINNADPLLPLPTQWTLDYQIETAVWTDVIDLGASFADYVWLVDSAIWLRRETLEIERQVETEVRFIGNNVAALNIRSNEDKLTSVLTADNGIIRTQVDESFWDYVGSNQISIDGSVFDAASVYTFTYTGVTGAPTPQAKFVLEWRSATLPGSFSSPGSAAVPAWTAVEEGFVVDRTHRYHQLRVRMFDISSPRDVRIYGLGLRGVNLYGSPPSAPGILLP